MPNALVIWRDGRTRVVRVPDSVPMTFTVVEREGAAVGSGRVPPARSRAFARAEGHHRAVIYEEPADDDGA